MDVLALLRGTGSGKDPWGRGCKASMGGVWCGTSTPPCALCMECISPSHRQECLCHHQHPPLLTRRKPLRTRGRMTIGGGGQRTFTSALGCMLTRAVLWMEDFHKARGFVHAVKY